MQISLRPVDLRIVRSAVGQNWFIPGISKSDRSLRNAVKGELQRTIKKEFGLRQEFSPSPEAISYAYSQLLFVAKDDIPAFETLDYAVNLVMLQIKTNASKGQNVGAELNDTGKLLWLNSDELIDSLKRYQAKVGETAEKRKAQIWSVLPYQFEKTLVKGSAFGINVQRILYSFVISGICLAIGGLELLGAAFAAKGLQMFIRSQQANFGYRLDQRIKATKNEVREQTSNPAED